MEGNNMKKLLVLLGAIALTFTLANAGEKCESGKCNGDMKKMEKKCNGGKCDASKKNVKKCNGAKCSADKKEKKEAPAKGKCGQGKCG